MFAIFDINIIVILLDLYISKKIMNNNNFDVVIVGGGLIGLCLSCFLDNLGISIAIIDKNPITNKQEVEKDIRTTAISEGSKAVLDSFGLWKKIVVKAQSIKKIKVIDRNQSNNIDFTNPNNSDCLGYIVENKFIKKILINNILLKKNISFYEKTEILDIHISNDFSILKTNKGTISSKLLIAADGKNSFVRKIMKQSVFSKRYNQNAMVTNFFHSKSHNDTAYEFFYNSGPLASLPMCKNVTANRSSLVWSHHPEYISNLNSANDNLLKLLIEERVKKYLGNVTKIICKKTFPLSAHINTKFGNYRLVYVGDAAHSIHPIAGQGWNLGLSDARELTSIIGMATNLGLDIGTNFVCKKYHKMRFFDTYSLFQITDKLNSIFMYENSFMRTFRNIGFNIIDSNNLLKNKIANYAMRNTL